MSKDKIRVGVIGCGGMAAAHARRFSKVSGEMEVTALVDIVRERAEAVAELLNNKPVIATEYREVLSHVDAVLVVLPHHLHHPVTIDCLDSGKHVLVEKPLANSEQECLEMIDAAERNNRVLMVAYSMRFHPLVCELKRLLDAKEYGDVFQLSIWTEQYTEYPEGHWARCAKTLGGGQLFSHGCHYIDLMLWMLGTPVSGVHMGTNTGTPWMEREGTSNVTIEFEGGVLGYHGATWGARGSRLRYSCHAHCTQGMLEADLYGGKLYAHTRMADHEPGDATRQSTKVLLEAPNAKPTAEEMLHFIECIRTGIKPLTDPVSSLKGLRVIWALYDAEQKGIVAPLKERGLGTIYAASRNAATAV